MLVYYIYIIYWTVKRQETSTMVFFPTERKKIYVCYCENDQKLFSGSLLPHLKPLEKTYSIEIWSYTNIKIGTNRHQEIDHAIQTTIMAILLVSAHFFASDSIQQKELPLLLKARSRKEIIIVPLLLSACDYENSLLKEFQFANPQKPLDRMSSGERSEACKNTVAAIRKLLDASSLSTSSLYLSALEQKKKETTNKPVYLDLLQNLSNQTIPHESRVITALNLMDIVLKANEEEKRSLRGHLHRMRLDENSELIQDYIIIILGLLDDVAPFNTMQFAYQNLYESLPLHLRNVIEECIYHQDDKEA
jgi:hypothetical protein